MSASSPPSAESASRSASIRTTALVIVMAMRIIRTAARWAAPAVRRWAAAKRRRPALERRPSLKLARLQALQAGAEHQPHGGARHAGQPAGLGPAQRERDRQQHRRQRPRAEQVALVV